MLTPIYLYPVAFLIFFILIKHKKNNLVYTTLVFTFFLSAVTAVYIKANLYHFFDVGLSIIAILYHILMTLIILWQFRYFDKFQNRALPKVQNPKLLETFSYIIIFFCLLSIIFSLQNVNLDVMMTDVRSLRALVNEEKKITVIGYIAFFGNKYAYVALALAFYFMIHYPSKKILIWILIICSLTQVISGLHVAAREYLVKYIYIFMIIIYLCRKQISGNIKRGLKTFLKIFVVLGGTLFWIISSLRFADNVNAESIASNNNTVNALLSYFGQGWAHFSDIFDTFIVPKTTPGAIHFPFFAGETISSKNLNDVIFVDVYLNQFSTSLGSWMVDGGLFFATLVTILYAVIIRYIVKLRYNVFTLIYTLWAYDFIFSYIFFYNETINTSRIFSLMFVVFFDYMERHSRVNTEVKSL